MGSNGPPPIPLLEPPAWLSSGAPGTAAEQPVVRQVSTGGLRNEEPLTDAQKAEVLAYAAKLGIPEDVIQFSDHSNTSYCNMLGQDILVVGTDAYPAEGATAANSRISMEGALAHEWLGHGDAAREGHTQQDNLLEEVQASVRAALFAPDLSDAERQTLVQDAEERLAKAGQTLDDVRGQLWLDPK